MVQVHSYGSWPQSTLPPISSNIRRIRLTFSVATELNQQMQSNTAVSTVNIPKTKWSCSWKYNINKLLVSPSERLNNIRLQRTIVTYPASKFHGERIQRYLWNREHMERKTKDYMACSHAHIIVAFRITSQLRYQFTARDVPLQKLSGVAILVSLQECGLTSHRTFLSAKSQAKIRLAFYFVEHNNPSNIFARAPLV